MTECECLYLDEERLICCFCGRSAKEDIENDQLSQGEVAVDEAFEKRDF